MESYKEYVLQKFLEIAINENVRLKKELESEKEWKEKYFEDASFALNKLIEAEEELEILRMIVNSRKEQ